MANPNVPNILNAVPVMVTFGAAQIGINDGPSALGFIFSIANPPATALPQLRTFENYALPLLALYSRCLYLAYIKNGVAYVPKMSCGMYASGLNPFPLLLGSTYVTSSSNSQRQAFEEGLRQMMNRWRRQSVIQPGLDFYVPQRQLPSLAPNIRKKVIKGFYQAFRGFSINEPGRALPRRPRPNTPPRFYLFTECVDPNVATQQFNGDALFFNQTWQGTTPGNPPIIPLPKDSVYTTHDRTVLAGAPGTNYFHIKHLLFCKKLP